MNHGLIRGSEPEYGPTFRHEHDWPLRKVGVLHHQIHHMHDFTIADEIIHIFWLLWSYLKYFHKPKTYFRKSEPFKKIKFFNYVMDFLNSNYLAARLMISSALTSTSKILNLPSAANSLLLKIYFFFLLILKCIFLKLFFSPISIIVPHYLYIFPIPYLTNCTNYIISACISYFVLNWITSLLRLNRIFSRL